MTAAVSPNYSKLQKMVAPALHTIRHIFYHRIIVSVAIKHPLELRFCFVTNYVRYLFTVIFFIL